MFSWFLLLLVLTSTVCVGAFVVNVTQSVYQVEENEDVTLEWSFPLEADITRNRLFILCDLVIDSGRDTKVVYHLHEGVEVLESQDQQFSGRVQCDNKVAGEGRLGLRVSRVRTEDAGLYLCEVSAGSFDDFGKCQLDVTAAADEPNPQREGPQPEGPQPEGLSFIVTGAILGLTAVVAAVVLLAVLLVRRSGSNCTNSKNLSTEEKSIDPESRQLSKSYLAGLLPPSRTALMTNI